VVVRENTEGIRGAGGFPQEGTPDEVALQRLDQHAQGRRAHASDYAFDYTASATRGIRLTLCRARRTS